MMIILHYAYFAYLAMISTFWYCSSAIKTVSLHSLLPSNQQFIEILAISSLSRSFQQTKIQQKHDTEDSNFSSKPIGMSKLDDQVEKSDVKEKRCHEDYRNTATTMLRLVLNLDVAIKFDEVTTRVLLIQHLSYSLILIFPCDLKGRKIRIISKIPVRSFQQQLANNSCVSIVDCHHQWCISFIVTTIQCCQFLAGEQIADHFFTAHVTGPVESTAAVAVTFIDADAIFEVDQRQNHVGLCCQMQRIKACVGCELLIDTEIFGKVPDHIHMPVIASVEQCGKALTVLQVHPDCDLLVLVPLIQLLLPSSLAQEPSCPRDEEPHDIQLPFIGQLMQNGVVLGICKGNEIEIRVLVQVVTELIYLTIREEQIDYLALFPPSRSWLTNFDHNIKQSLLT